MVVKVRSPRVPTGRRRFRVQVAMAVLGMAIAGTVPARAQGDAAAVLAERRAAVARAPDDLGARAALARALLAAGDRAGAEAEIDAIEARDPANAEAAAIRLDLAPIAPVMGETGDATDPATRPRRRLTLSPEAGLARVTGRAGRSAATWSTQRLGVNWRAGEATTVSGEVDREDRDVSIDTRLALRLDRRLSPWLRGYVAASATPDADFRERWRVATGGEADLIGPLTLRIDLRRADFAAANGDVQTSAIVPGIAVSSQPLRSSFHLAMTNLWDERGRHRTGWAGGVETQLRPELRLSATLASVPETEAGITRTTRSANLTAAWTIEPCMTLRFGLTTLRRVDTYTRRGATLGLDLRF